MASKKIRLGLIGAGIFAREAHLPSLDDLRHLFDVVAVCSRRQVTARARADQWLAGGTSRPDVYTDSAALLARDDVDAVDIVLPIDKMPSVVIQALRAGKHVLSEKPIATTVAEAQRMLSIHQNHDQQVWMVGENWRYESAFRLAADMIQRKAIGNPITAHFSAHIKMGPENRYWQTGWRREWDYLGSWLLDFGVHHVAVMRAALGEIADVQATATLVDPQLKTLDTISAAMRFEGGTLGTYSLTCAAKSQWLPRLSVVGDKGSLMVQSGKIGISTGDETRVIECPMRDGVVKELDAFAFAILRGHPHLNTPASALQDVAVVEAMLTSSTAGERVAIPVMMSD